MHRPGRIARGFSLIEAAVAIGIMAIMAAAAAPLVMKALNQQREQRVRTEMKLAFETLFGSRERVVPNMRSDFGFAPIAPPNIYNLGKMMNSGATPLPLTPPYGPNGSVFQWGWNGPYWSGQTLVIGGIQVPVDPWGRPYWLRIVTGASSGYQVLCAGLNGVVDTAINSAAAQGDDLVYPSTPISATSNNGSMPITILNGTAADQSVTVAVQWKNGSALSSATSGNGVKTQSVTAGKTGSFLFSSIPAGILQVTISYIVGTTTITTTYVYELAPGQTLPLHLSI